MDSQAQRVGATEPDSIETDRARLQKAVSAVQHHLDRCILELDNRPEHEETLADLRKCALAASRAAQALASGDSLSSLRHDLRNQFGVIKGYLELLLEENSGVLPSATLGQLRELAAQLREATAPLLKPALTDTTGEEPPRLQLDADSAGSLLVIDDSEHSRELLSRHLRRQGHQVLCAASGAEAMSILAGTPVDLVFLDLVMPEMNGLELLRLIKSDPALHAVPVIIVSGEDDDEGVIRCIEAGAEDYLHKPFNPVLLQARLRAGLERKRWHDREDAYRRELERNQRFIRNTFGRYLSDEIVDALLDSPQGLNLGGSTCRVTILMSDIRNFSTICENHAPEQVVALLNNYLGEMSEIVIAHNGTVDEFIGDAILAIFGAPVQREDDARRAVACALQMMAAAQDINRRNRELGLPEVSTGIGLNTGIVVAGNIGSEKRSKYGVVGHTVNLTARIESYTQAGEILAAHSTLLAAGKGIRTGRQFSTRPKGMAAEVSIHQIVGMDGVPGGQEQETP